METEPSNCDEFVNIEASPTDERPVNIWLNHDRCDIAGFY
jgi:hypothetical protein